MAKEINFRNATGRKIILKNQTRQNKTKWKMANCKEYKKFLIILKNKNMQKQEIKGRKSKKYKKKAKNKNNTKYAKSKEH